MSGSGVICNRKDYTLISALTGPRFFSSNLLLEAAGRFGLPPRIYHPPETGARVAFFVRAGQILTCGGQDFRNKGLQFSLRKVTSKELRSDDSGRKHCI